MTRNLDHNITAAEVVLPCCNLQEMLAFFIEQLGFRLETIFPSDAPQVAVISGYGSRLRLVLGVPGPAPTIHLVCERETPPSNELEIPKGIDLEWVTTSSTVKLPPLTPSFHVSTISNAEWSVGRAGMRYRDLIPDRQGGLFIASHILIPEAGPVPDYPHFHKVLFQLIFCHKGWVRVVYEDQGEAFIMNPGDCVLQPPEIRHQVLECSANLEVIEIGCPAIHETWADHDLALPSASRSSRRLFSGQRFVHHVAAEALWAQWVMAGFEYRDTGIMQATGGIVSVTVIRRDGGDIQTVRRQHDNQLAFTFVLQGSATLCCDNNAKTSLSASDSYVIPPHHHYQLKDCSNDLELLQVEVS